VGFQSHRVRKGDLNNNTRFWGKSLRYKGFNLIE